MSQEVIINDKNLLELFPINTVTISDDENERCKN